jgi:hypothetical protein
MNASIEPLENLQRRLERLERQNALLRRLGLAAAAVLAVAVISGQAAPPTDDMRHLTAQSFRLVDAEGKLRGELALGDDGPLLRLLDAEGRPRATLTGGKQAGWSLHDQDGKPRVAAFAGEEFGLAMLDTEGMSQARLAVAADRQALDLFDKGKRRATIEIVGGDATAALMSEQGNARAMMSAGKDSAGKETAACALHDPLGNRQFAVTTRSEGTLLSLYDKNAVSRLTVTVNEVGSGYFIKDDKGKLRMQLQLADDKPQFGLFDNNGNELFAKP